MNIRRLCARAIAESVALGNAFSRPPSGLRILMYHAIGSPALGDTLGLFSLSPALFKTHLDLLVEQRSMEVVDLLPEIRLDPHPSIAITFDDGYLDNLDVAAPLLVERSLPFTVFVTSEFIRLRRKGFMSPENLRELASLPGVRIGAHGASHIALSGCDNTMLEHELKSSKRYLEDITGREVSTMAYPYGASSRKVSAAAGAAGYRLAACSHAGINTPARDRLLLCRTEITAYDTSRVFRQKLMGHWDWYRFRTQDPASR